MILTFIAGFLTCIGVEAVTVVVISMVSVIKDRRQAMRRYKQ